MPILPDEKNPLIKNDIYEILKIDPNATESDIKSSLKNYSVKSLPKEQQKKALDKLKESLQALKSSNNRVRINALKIDKVDSKTVEKRLNHLPNLKTANLQLPKPDLSYVYIEGQSLEIAETDFQPAKKVKDLELDLNSINYLLYKNNIEQHIIFEI